MKRSLIIFMVLILCCITTSCYTTIEKIPVEEYQKLEGSYVDEVESDDEYGSTIYFELM